MSHKKTTDRPVPVPDPHHAHVLPGPSNEELIQRQAEAEQRHAASGYPKVQLVSDAHDKQMDAYADLDFDPLGLSDPLAQIKNEYGREGFALKALSDNVNNKLGRRGYQIVKDENGDPVRFGNMVIGEIPERIAQQRRKAPIVRSNDELSSIQNAHRESLEKLKTDARNMGLTVLEPGERVT